MGLPIRKPAAEAKKPQITKPAPAKATEAPVDTGAPLHIKYRPTKLEDVLGQGAVVTSLQKVLSKHTPHAYLFTGPSGTGKTTLARILMSMLGVDDQGILEIDAATHSGVNDMRQITEVVKYKSLGRSARKGIIVDECHALSKQTWQSLLLALEEPPEHVFWALCTTEPDKVPEAVRTRCHAYQLRPVDWEQVHEMLETVTKRENLEVSNEVQGLIARRCEGSVRQALQWLSMLDGITDKEQINDMLEQVSKEQEAIDLARFLTQRQGVTWPEAIRKIEALGTSSPESVRIVVVNYVAAVLAKTKGEQEAGRLLAVLAAFSTPFNPSEKKAPLLLAVGSLILGQ